MIDVWPCILQSICETIGDKYNIEIYHYQPKKFSISNFKDNVTKVESTLEKQYNFTTTVIVGVFPKNFHKVPKNALSGPHILIDMANLVDGAKDELHGEIDTDYTDYSFAMLNKINHIYVGYSNWPQFKTWFDASNEQSEPPPPLFTIDPGTDKITTINDVIENIMQVAHTMHNTQFKEARDVLELDQNEFLNYIKVNLNVKRLSHWIPTHDKMPLREIFRVIWEFWNLGKDAWVYFNEHSPVVNCTKTEGKWSCSSTTQGTGASKTPVVVMPSGVFDCKYNNKWTCKDVQRQRQQLLHNIASHDLKLDTDNKLDSAKDAVDDLIKRSPPHKQTLLHQETLVAIDKRNNHLDNEEERVQKMIKCKAETIKHDLGIRGAKDDTDDESLIDFSTLQRHIIAESNNESQNIQITTKQNSGSCGERYENHCFWISIAQAIQRYYDCKHSITDLVTGLKSIVQRYSYELKKGFIEYIQGNFDALDINQPRHRVGVVLVAIAEVLDFEIGVFKNANGTYIPFTVFNAGGKYKVMIRNVDMHFDLILSLTIGDTTYRTLPSAGGDTTYRTLPSAGGEGAGGAGGAGRLVWASAAASPAEWKCPNCLSTNVNDKCWVCHTLRPDEWDTTSGAGAGGAGGSVSRG